MAPWINQVNKFGSYLYNEVLNRSVDKTNSTIIRYYKDPLLVLLKDEVFRIHKTFNNFINLSLNLVI